MLSSETGYTNFGGAQLYFEGSGSGEPLVLIHGFGLDHRMWNSQVDSFSSRWRTIRYDMRGFGRSTPPEEGTPYSHAEDLAAMLVQLGIGRANLCGLSLGGEVAVDFALRYPAVTASLILVDSVLDGFQWSDRQKGLDGEVWKTGRDLGVEAARARWKAHPLFVPLMEHPEAWSLFETMVDDYSGWHWQHRNPFTWSEPDAIDRLGEINAPALVITGGRDLPDFLQVADVLEWGLPRAKRVTLEGAGHLSNMEAPEEFNRAVLTFLVGRAVR